MNRPSDAGPVSELRVDANGHLECGGRVFRCAVGRGGVSPSKREGDGATPAGRFPVRRLFYRPDRLEEPATALPRMALSPADGWCDDPEHPDYNRLVRLPHPARCEHLWRDDGLYDLFVELGYNDDPPVPGLGSAIFLHVARESYAPTEGCVALAISDLSWVVGRLSPAAVLTISLR